MAGRTSVRYRLAAARDVAISVWNLGGSVVSELAQRVRRRCPRCGRRRPGRGTLCRTCESDIAAAPRD